MQYILLYQNRKTLLWDPIWFHRFKPYIEARTSFYFDIDREANRPKQEDRGFLLGEVNPRKFFIFLKRLYLGDSTICPEEGVFPIIFLEIITSIYGRGMTKGSEWDDEA
jgi:hypothetical protein